MNFKVIMIVLVFVGPLAVSESAVSEETTVKQFKRLFTSVNERKTIDEQREFGIEINSVNEETDAPSNGEAPADFNSLRFSGYVASSLGEHQIWINGESDLTKGAKLQPVRLLKKTTQQLEISARNAERWLKPGQVWLDESSSVLESYSVPKIMRAENADDASFSDIEENYEDLGSEDTVGPMFKGKIRALEDLPVNDQIKQSLQQVQESRQGDKEFLDKYFPSGTTSRQAEN